jgi:hypothetical protein
MQKNDAPNQIKTICCDSFMHPPFNFLKLVNVAKGDKTYILNILLSCFEPLANSCWLVVSKILLILTLQIGACLAHAWGELLQQTPGLAAESGLNLRIQNIEIIFQMNDAEAGSAHKKDPKTCDSSIGKPCSGNLKTIVYTYTHTDILHSLLLQMGLFASQINSIRE